VADLPMADRHETVLPPEPEDIAEALTRALAAPEVERKDALAEVVASRPTLIAGWAELASLGDQPIERYAYARVGYHRGLDALRANGWGGRGFVRWSQPTNRPLLTCLVRLRAAAAEIGEVAEVQRLTDFLHDLDPEWDEGNTA
jgi:hypothetical protein